MRTHALLLLTLAVLAHARAASIPDHIVPELEAKLSEAVKEVLDKDAGSLKDDLADQALIDQVNAVESSYVEVAGTEPSLKINDSPSDDVEPHRVEIDLENPGPPQMQRHDAQNPEIYNEAKLKEASVNHQIAESQNILHKGLLNLNEKVRMPILNEEKISEVKNNINNLQENFSKHIRVLNEAVKLYLEPQSASDLRSAAVADSLSSLKNVENSFDVDAAKLSEDISKLKADGAVATNSTTQNPFEQFVIFLQQTSSNIQTQIQNTVSNINSTIYQTFNPNKNGTANQQGWWQNPFQQNQANQQPTQEQPGIFGFFNNIVNYFNPSQTTTVAPQKETVANTVPVNNGNPTTSQPDQEATNSGSTRIGPIQQVLLKSPIVQGISGAVQKVKGSVTEVEVAKDAVEPTLKGYGGSRPGTEYSDDSDRLINEDAVMDDENKRGTTVQEVYSETQKDEKIATEEPITKVDYTMFKEENPTEATIVELTTKVEEPYENKVEILSRIKEETEDYKTELPTTGSPLKEEVATMVTDLMLGDEPKMNDAATTDTIMKEEYKTESTQLPNDSGEISATEAAMEMLIKDDTSVDSNLNKDTVELEVSGTEVPEVGDEDKKIESTTSYEDMKEVSMTTLLPSVGIEERNLEVETETEEVLKNMDLQTTVQTTLLDQDFNLEVLPKEEQAENMSTTEVSQAEENNSEQMKKEKHKGKLNESQEKKRNQKVVRRLIKRTPL